ncbi:ferritin family protein [Microbispora rosea]|uniref:ferritin family protein n=1 Tax=Microbispora rosea TaxID=58117 RepID=UPI0033D1BA3C
MYPAYARQASADGDTEAAKLLNDTANDELKHAKAFSSELSALGKRCPTSS